MRATVCLLLVVCLGLAGCKNTGRKDGIPPAPPLNPSAGGSGPPRADASRTDPSAPPPGAEGVLAGQVLDAFGHHPDGVSIQIVDLQDTRQTPARIEVEPPEKGYFMIQGLEVGRHYQLIARLKDGTKLISGTTLATPPNPRVTIYLSEDNTNEATPAPPGPPSLPEKRKPLNGGAAIEAPRRTDQATAGDGENPPHQGSTSPAGGGAVIPAPPQKDAWVPTIPTPVTPKVNPSKMADGPGRIGVPPPVIVPNPFAPKPEKNDQKEDKSPAPPLDELPSTNAGPAPKQPAKSEKPPAADGARAPTPPGPNPLNSCVLVGKKLEDFTLLDLEGQPWQYKRDHKGQVVLLDFWSTRNDLGHVHQMRELQNAYGPRGLEVVGIAYEDGTLDDQVRNVRPVRGRYTINYTTILGGPADTCQVKKQFDVNQLPALVLLDEQGKIVLRADPGDQAQLQEVESEIRKQLGVAETLPRAGQ